MKDITLRCSCMAPEHSLFFLFNKKENEIYTEVYLHQYRGFLKRLWIAIKYVFNVIPRYGHFACFDMTPEAAQKLRNAIDEFLEDENVE